MTKQASSVEFCDVGGVFSDVRNKTTLVRLMRDLSESFLCVGAAKSAT